MSVMSGKYTLHAKKKKVVRNSSTKGRTAQLTRSERVASCNVLEPPDTRLNCLGECQFRKSIVLLHLVGYILLVVRGFNVFCFIEFSCALPPFV